MRTLAVLLSLLVVGAAAAQPPVDYTLMCGEGVIGSASFVDGQYRFALLEGATCDEGTFAEDPSLTFAIVRDGSGVTVTIGDLSVVAEEVPQQALDGMRNAAANRAVAGRGQETAAGMIELHRPELPRVPAIHDRPDLPEAGQGRRP